MKFLTVRAMQRHKEEQGHHGDGGGVDNAASNRHAGGIGASAASALDSSKISDSVRDSVIAAAVAIANGSASPKIGQGGGVGSSAVSSPFANMAAAAAMKTANGSRSNSPMNYHRPGNGSGNGGSLKRSLADVALALAEGAEETGVKSLEDEMEFESANLSSGGGGGGHSSVFPEMQHQRHESVFPGAM